MSTGLRARLRPGPGARFVHPRAQSAPDADGEHDAALDVADDSSPNYLRWIADLVSPHLGESVLEVGAGIGSITQRYADGRRVVASDLSDSCVAALRERFAGSSNVSVSQQDLRAIGGEAQRFQSVLMINVLEHIEDDAGTLATLRGLLEPGGSIVLYVPALNGLYGAWDRKVGHFRRYSKWRMREVALEAGLEVEELRYVNALAIPAWVAFSRTNVERTVGRSLSLWDRTAVPITRGIEQRVRMPIGLNLLCVLRDR